MSTTTAYMVATIFQKQLLQKQIAIASDRFPVSVKAELQEVELLSKNWSEQSERSTPDRTTSR